MNCCCSGGKSSIFSALIAAGAVLAFAGLQAARSSEVQDQDAVRKAIAKAALDYPMSYYEGDPDRMARRLHPDLRKCIPVPPQDEDGEWTLREMTAQELIDIVASGNGAEIPEAARRHDVTVLDVFGDIASVRIDMHSWSDFIHMAKIDGEWKIVNVLWDFSPERTSTRE